MFENLNSELKARAKEEASRKCDYYSALVREIIDEKLGKPRDDFAEVDVIKTVYYSIPKHLRSKARH